MGEFGAVKEPQTAQADLVNGGIQANGYNHNGYFPTRNTVPGLSFEGPQLGNGVVLPTIEQDHRQSHAAVAYAYPTRTSVLNSLANGKRGFDAATFDNNLYSQAGASSPPPGVFVPARGVSPGPITEVKQPVAPEKVLYMHIDPRIHWAHDHSKEWYEQKMEEIRARGGRKANFGKAAQRMRKQRLADEAAAAARKGRKRPHHRPPEPWSHHRPLDFADVPNEELPRYVRNNPSWMKAVEWMRKNRRLNDEVNKQAASLIAEGRPWKHLFVNKRAKRA
ncbi:hypothetical protein CPLU01_06999 [Colletotrichum plurivorum]|uniref:Uncharacterized protein n=1 Tax=Colletotrichum plurivorum TaxID=2175906 RepID=A0A8H6NFL7_9PEZI|nr:hypothetical protein CPLU01_06999 [Colletotrichum plurivorum]